MQHHSNAGVNVGKIKNILLAQAEPIPNSSPYLALAKKYNVNIIFKPFNYLVPTPLNEFIKYKPAILGSSAVIFTSKTAIDHFFKLCHAIKLHISLNMKYFCTSSQIANYLQKYVTIKKRKVFVSKKAGQDMLSFIQKHQNEKYILPCSDCKPNTMTSFLHTSGCVYTEIILYKTVPNDLTEHSMQGYDIIAFFHPIDIQHFIKNFPDFTQQDLKIAVFGQSTAAIGRAAGLRIDIEAPLPSLPSMASALEAYIKQT